MCGLFQDIYVVEDCRSGCYGIVVCTVWSRTLHSSDEDKVDLKRLKL